MTRWRSIEDMNFLYSSLLLIQTALSSGIFNSLSSIQREFLSNGRVVHSDDIKRIQKRSSEMTLSSNNSSWSNSTNQCQHTKIGLRRCEKYSYTYCDEVVKWSNSSMISVNCSLTQARKDTILKTLEMTMKKNFGASEDCVKAARWSLCIYSHPPCNKTQALKSLLCKEACLLVRNVICKKEWIQIESLRAGNLISSDVYLTDCQTFPHEFPSVKNSSCLYPEFFHDLRRKYTTKDRAKDTKSNYHTIAIASAVGGGALLLILLAVVATMCFRRSRRKKGSGKDLQMGSITRNSEAFEEIEAHGTDISGHNNPSFSLTAARNSFEKLRVTLFPRDGLMFLDELGEGAFGKVIKCEIVGEMAAGRTSVCAVKYLKDDASDYTRSSFLREAEALASFTHPNIVSVAGLCLDDQGPLCLVLEFMKCGDLTGYIRERSGSYHASFGQNRMLPDDIEFEPPMLSFRELVFMARQIAAGMQYLAEKKYVHRDLATRNCLVDDQMVVKIADFGLGHDIGSTESGDYYRIDAQKLLPIRWLPPEALTVSKFTMQSDIWSFGVLIWELFTYGLQPYCGQTNDEVIKRILSFKLLECPDGCPQKVYLLMRACWRYELSKRLPFKKIEEMLAGWLKDKGEFLDEAWEKMKKPPVRRDAVIVVSNYSAPPLPPRERRETP